jgi:hypothetical protein
LYGQDIFLHPTIETYVNLRNYTYSRVYWWNFNAFFFLFILPFIPLMVINHRFKGSFDYGSQYNWTRVHYISILYLTIREIFQWSIEKRKRNYFKHISNWIEMALLIISILLIIFSTFYYDGMAIMILEILFTLTTAISATSMSYLASNHPVYIKSFKKIAMIFLKVIAVFIFIIIALAFCIYVVLIENDNDESENSTDDLSKSELAEAVLNGVVSSFLKVLTMLSGEFGLELDTMDSIQLIFCLAFVIISFILFNMILGISFKNIENIMNEARQLNVLDKIKDFIEMKKKWDVIKEK